jgi:hypothetical protein
MAHPERWHLLRSPSGHEITGSEATWRGSRGRRRGPRPDVVHVFAARIVVGGRGRRPGGVRDEPVAEAAGREGRRSRPGVGPDAAGRRPLGRAAQPAGPPVTVDIRRGRLGGAPDRLLGGAGQSARGARLDVEVASAGDGRTAIRLDAWVAWGQPRPASSLIPPTARTVTIANLGGGSPPAPVTITDPVAVRKLTALIDGLSLSTTAVGTPCPAPAGPYLSLTFRARPGGPVLAHAQTGEGCYTVALTLRGEQQPEMANEPTLDGQILRLAVLPREPS